MLALPSKVTPHFSHSRLVRVSVAVVTTAPTAATTGYNNKMLIKHFSTGNKKRKESRTNSNRISIGMQLVSRGRELKPAVSCLKLLPDNKHDHHPAPITR